MRCEILKKRLPAKWESHPHAKGLVAEGNIRLFRHAKLAAKVLVFKTPKDLRQFWSKALGHDLGSKCLGVVNSFAFERVKFRTGKPDLSTMCCDARFFCIIGLCAGHLTTEVIAHESVHAGFAYEKRVKRNMWGRAADGFDEERIAYPSGVIAQQLINFIWKRGLNR